MKTMKNIALIAAISLSYATPTLTLDQETLQKHLHDFQFSCDTAQEQDVKKVVDYLRNNPDQVNRDLIKKITKNAEVRAISEKEIMFFLKYSGNKLNKEKFINEAKKHMEKANNCATLYNEFIQLINEKYPEKKPLEKIEDQIQ